MRCGRCGHEGWQPSELFILMSLVVPFALWGWVVTNNFYDFTVAMGWPYFVVQYLGPLIPGMAMLLLIQMVDFTTRYTFKKRRPAAQDWQI